MLDNLKKQEELQQKKHHAENQKALFYKQRSLTEKKKNSSSINNGNNIKKEKTSKPAIKFYCSKCTLEFGNRSSLNMHVCAYANVRFSYYFTGCNKYKKN